MHQYTLALVMIALFITGIVWCIRVRNSALIVYGVIPLALTLAAAFLHEFPFGSIRPPLGPAYRVNLFLAPPIFIIVACGIALLVSLAVRHKRLQGVLLSILILVPPAVFVFDAYRTNWSPHPVPVAYDGSAAVVKKYYAERSLVDVLYMRQRMAHHLLVYSGKEDISLDIIQGDFEINEPVLQKYLNGNLWLKVDWLNVDVESRETYEAALARIKGRRLWIMELAAESALIGSVANERCLLLKDISEKNVYGGLFQC
ncbi:MAG: hypothetical protein L0312_22040, partial [Acidobacteria bacterium]|nr:hypothetical protein [Acidobacteriota bacterium]